MSTTGHTTKTTRTSRQNRSIGSALTRLGKELKKEDVRKPIPFRKYLQVMQTQPERTLRNVFQLFYDMIHYYVPSGQDEYPNDPESINYIFYDTSWLLVENSSNPYFADRLFANRLINQARALKETAQQNFIYLFEGPPGTGKSTFLNNLLQKMEDFTLIDEGSYWETTWQLDVAKLGGFSPMATVLTVDGDLTESEETILRPDMYPDKTLMVPCPCHCHPVIQIPKAHREEFLSEIMGDSPMLDALLDQPQYAWVLEDEPCTVCQSLYNAVLEKVHSPTEVLNMIFPRRYTFNRRLGEGVSVYNPGDTVVKRPITNPVLQNLLNNLFRDSNSVRYVYSRMGKTNNGVFAIMDVKSQNRDRIINLHGIISDRVHKVEYLEEYVSSLFLCVVNPEDEKFLQEIPSYEDRVVRIRMPYVLDYLTESAIYRDKIGEGIRKRFLPGALETFAKVIISSRLKSRSEAIDAWIKDKKAYRAFADEHLLLLKMDVYTGLIPAWLSEADLKRFEARHRRALIGEGEFEGTSGISGRFSVQLFIKFFSQFKDKQKLIVCCVVEVP